MSQIPPPPLPAPDLSKPMDEQNVEKSPDKSQIMNALVNTTFISKRIPSNFYHLTFLIEPVLVLWIQQTYRRAKLVHKRFQKAFLCLIPHGHNLRLRVK